MRHRKRDTNSRIKQGETVEEEGKQEREEGKKRRSSSFFGGGIQIRKRIALIWR